MYRWKATILAALVFASQPAQAWNARGHMIIAAAAWQQLDPETSAKVSALLRRHPFYIGWTRDVPPEERDLVAFMQAAIWADEIKEDWHFVDDDDAQPLHSGTGFGDLRRHKEWHYINRPFTQDGSPLPAVPKVNALAQIEALTSELRSSNDENIRSYNLTWLIHLVGDVHQPLHATTRVMRFAPKGDKGGLETNISCANCYSGLHSFWDGALGTGRKPREISKYLQKPDVRRAIFPVIETSVRHAPPSAWIAESFSLAKSEVYVSPIRRDGEVSMITVGYRKRAATLSYQQMSLAAARLAHLLNTNI